MTTTTTKIMIDSTQGSTQPEASTTRLTDKQFKQDAYQHVHLCDGLYATDFCLNGGTCFIHKYYEAQIFVCECAEFYHGSRCEEKSLEGSYGGGMKLRIRRSRRRRISRMFFDFSSVLFLLCCKLVSRPLNDPVFLLYARRDPSVTLRGGHVLLKWFFGSSRINIVLTKNFSLFFAHLSLRFSWLLLPSSSTNCLLC